MKIIHFYSQKKKKMKDGDGDGELGTPPDVKEVRDAANSEMARSIIPAKSFAIYERSYNHYIQWAASKQVSDAINLDNLKAYFLQELAGNLRYTCATMRSKLAQLRVMMFVNNGVSQDHPAFDSIAGWITNSVQLEPPRPSTGVFQIEHIKNFLKKEADGGYDDDDLNARFIVALAMNRGCRTNEIFSLSHRILSLMSDRLVINIYRSKADRRGNHRPFTILPNAHSKFLSAFYWYRKY